MDDQPEVVLLAVQNDDHASDGPRALRLYEQWRGSLPDAKVAFSEEPEVMVALSVLDAQWATRAINETELWHRIDLGAGGILIVAFEAPARGAE